MTRRVLMAVVAALLCASCTQPEPAPVAIVGHAEKFDPQADPGQQVTAAISMAGQTKRRIMLDVGGEWCVWCHTLDRFIDDHPDLSAAIARDFVWVKINFSPENPNKVFLDRYPSIPGYPHLFVLSDAGELLHSQDTSELEEGRSYNLEKMRTFLAKWAPR
ncbi:MAG: thioredoxin family protein [Vicinamibacterales bacterium]